MTTTVHTSPRGAEQPKRPQRRRRRRLRPAEISLRIIVVAIVVVQIYPLAWLLMSSVRTKADFAAGNAFGIPGEVTLDNYVRAFQVGNIPHYILNSLIVTIGSNILIILLGMMAAYAIEVIGFRFSNAVRMTFLLGIIVPVQIALVPLFIDYSSVGLLDTYLSMIIPLAGFALPMSVYLFSAFYSYIPREIYESATLDGAGPYRIFWRITSPLSVNTIVTVFFVNAIFIWNDFIFGNTFVLSEGMKTIPLGLQNYVGAMGNTDWTATFAAVCVTITPLMLVFLVMNKAIIYGIEGGANKG